MPFKKLVKGFGKFRKTYFKDSDVYKDLVRNGQSPEALVIACSDSRNDPALLMQSDPGDIFVVRNVAALVPPYQPDNKYHGTSAGIEFAVKGLKVKDIIVLGHALCGGIGALDDIEAGKTLEYEFLSQWIMIGASAKEKIHAELKSVAKEDRLRALEQAAILTSLNNLMTFPWIRERVSSGTLSLHGWYFDMVAGEMLSYDFGKGAFRPLSKSARGFSEALDNDDGSQEWSLKNYA